MLDAFDHELGKLRHLIDEGLVSGSFHALRLENLRLLLHVRKVDGSRLLLELVEQASELLLGKQLVDNHGVCTYIGTSGRLVLEAKLVLLDSAIGPVIKEPLGAFRLHEQIGRQCHRCWILRLSALPAVEHVLHPRVVGWIVLVAPIKQHAPDAFPALVDLLVEG